MGWEDTHYGDPFWKNVFKIFLLTPTSLCIYVKLKTLEFEASKMCFWPTRHWLKFEFWPILFIFEAFWGPLNPSPYIFKNSW